MDKNTKSGTGVKGVEKKLDREDGMLGANQELRGSLLQLLRVDPVAACGPACPLRMRSIDGCLPSPLPSLLGANQELRGSLPQLLRDDPGGGMRTGMPASHEINHGCLPSLSDSLPSISSRLVSFTWRYHRSSLVRPHQLGTELWINLELVSRCSGRPSRWRRQGLPSSRGTLLIIRHVLRPRSDRAR